MIADFGVAGSETRYISGVKFIGFLLERLQA
jgi:hypothetical protein